MIRYLVEGCTSVSTRIPDAPCTTLTPPRAQYGATLSKAQKRNRLIYAGIANLCKPLQRMIYHS